jgi:hypothetical protein
VTFFLFYKMNIGVKISNGAKGKEIAAFKAKIL